MRGKVRLNILQLVRGRITPAYAGKRRRSSSRDHPRLCGEKLLPDFLFLANRGSPPPMRGKVGHDILQCFVQRITPAYAGKRLPVHHLSSIPEDHPRLCGEKSVAGLLVVALAGSPPPMRGKGDDCHFDSMYVGITPAYAGKSSTAYPDQTNQGDHPRLCGEKPKP